MSDPDPASTPGARRLVRRFVLVDGIAALFLALLAGIFRAGATVIGNHASALCS